MIRFRPEVFARDQSTFGVQPGKIQRNRCWRRVIRAVITNGLRVRLMESAVGIDGGVLMSDGD